MTKCEHWDCGWCCAPTDVKTNALGSGVCNLPEYCPYLKSQNQMTDMFISIDAEATLGTKCPTHKLEIKKMTEIEEVKAQLKVLQSKLSFLEELSKTKSPVEEAYKGVYGWYPPTTPSVSNAEDERWSNFQKGYNASKEECKVEEKPKPKPETLYNIVRHTLGYSIDCCDEIVDAVEEWILDEQSSAGSQNVDVELLVEGFNDAIKKIKQNLR